ncbi:NHLP bacteriocin export ABC transporter permease/ATPase subunit [Ancylobacter sp.]|uniref:NHLP bacteriocin export ABC transporter permease/ATPase subunit n=1 Tax=Ancylobacter sp. TaxID=1872567 RepID=UPI003D0A1748
MLPSLVNGVPPIAAQEAQAGLDLRARLILVESGTLDLFIHDPARAGSRQKVATIPAGGAVFPVPGDDRFGLVGFPAEETRLVPLDAEAFGRRLDAGDAAAIALAEGWIELVARAVAVPGSTRSLSITPQTLRLSSHGPSRPSGAVLWLSVQEGAVHPDLAPEVVFEPGAPAFPLSPASPGGAVAQAGGATVTCRSSAALAAEGALAAAFHAYGGLVARAIGNRLQAEQDRRADSFARAVTRQRETVVRPFLGLVAEEARARPSAEADPLADAFRAVAAANGVELADDAFDACPPPGKASTEERLAAFARAARMRLRAVRLEGRWWRHSGQNAVVFEADSQMPLAALARTGWRRGYDIVGPQGHAAAGKRSAGRLAAIGYVAQRALPAEPIDGYGLLRFSAPLALPLMLPILLVALAGGLLGLATPLATQILFETVIPSSSTSQLSHLVAGLAGLSIGMTLFTLVRAFLLLRLSTLVNADLEGAIWDKLLRLPTTFFRRFTTGDLALRAGAVNQMRDIASGTILNTALSSIFSVLNLVLLLYYSLPLAGLALLVVAVQVTVTVGVSIAIMRLSRRALELDGRLQSLSLQNINAIGKLKVAGAESRAFARWATPFVERRNLDLQRRRLSAMADVCGAVCGVLSLAVLIWAVGLGGFEIGLAQFAAFNAALGQFLASTLALAGALPALLQMRPLYERARPLLQALPEDEAHAADPGPLRGDVELHEVVFRYAADGPAVLDKVSLRARPGEFIAIVGPSGAGKSTLLRLLLGFEKAGSGSLFFDQKDSAALDMRAVRRQMGVVLQNGHAATGSILENIIGGAVLTEEDAWEAARLAGLDEDVRQMPMQMHTFAGENAMLLSGGQRQRLLIARAVVKRPRLVLFDEATSALDNRSQQIVSERLAGLEATRIVIAHRLSTVVAADRIYVMEAGRVAEEGTYAELVAQGGLFAALARRQSA